MADLGAARQQMLVDELISFARQYEFMIVDVGAGIGNSVTSFLASVPEVAVVVANEPTSIMDAYSLIKVLSQQPTPPNLSLIVNMVHSLDEGQLLASRLNTITERFLGFTIRTAGIVMYDRLVGDAIRARTPTLRYAESSAVSHCIREIAREIAYKYPARARLRSERSFFGSLTGVGTQPPEGTPPP
jgi:flagellar biosynthesis protein FlhG